MAKMVTKREMVMILYELNGGDFGKIVKTMRERHLYSSDEMETALKKFTEKHEDERIITIVDDDYPMKYRNGYKKPPFVVFEPKPVTMA